MSQQFRLLLKAVALGRYLLTKNRIDVGYEYRSIIFRRLVLRLRELLQAIILLVMLLRKSYLFQKDKSVIWILLSLYIEEKFHLKRIRKRLGIYASCLAFVGFVSYEYHNHLSYVPITNRKHFVVLYSSHSYMNRFYRAL